MDTRLTWALVALFASAALSRAGSAQSARIFGKVVDRNGAAVEGAQVVLRSHGWLYHPELGEVHEVRMASGKNGRFRGKAFASRAYSAWAKLPGDEPRLTEIAENVIAGTPVTLRAESFERARITVLVSGLQAWKKHGPFRFRVTSKPDNFEEVVLDTDDKGRLPLPSFAGPWASVTVLDNENRPFLAKRFKYTRAEQEPSGGEESPSERALFWKIPPPFTVRITTRDIAAPQAAIEGARLEWTLTTTHWRTLDFRKALRRRVKRVLGRTNAQGILEIEMPITKKRLWQELAAQSKDHVLTKVRLKPHGTPDFTTVVEAEDVDHAILVRLRKGTSIRGRVVDAAGKGIAGLTLRYPQPLTSWFDAKRSTWHTGAPLLVKTDREGRFRFDPLLRDQKLRIFALPNAEQRALLAPNLPPTLARSLDLGEHRIGRKARCIDAGDLRVNTRSLQLALVDKGQPVAGAQLVAIPDDERLRAAAVSRTFSDRRGRATLLVPSSACRVIAWHPRHGYATAKFTDAGNVEDVRKISLESYSWVSGTVTDARGKPVPRASLDIREESYRGPIREHILSINASMRPGYADEQGRFLFPYIPEKHWSAKIAASARIQKKRYSSELLSLHAKDTGPVPVREAGRDSGEELGEKPGEMPVDKPGEERLQPQKLNFVLSGPTR